MPSKWRASMGGLRHWVTVLLIASMTAPCAFAGAQPARKKPPQPDWLRFVNEAYTLSPNFSPEEKADLLLDMLDVPALSQEQKERWSLEIFSLATKDIRPSHYRAAMQKNALVALCKVNPEKAAALYTTQDTPEMWHQDVLMEDYRAFGARTLFPALWAQSRMASIPTIRSIANW